MKPQHDWLALFCKCLCSTVILFMIVQVGRAWEVSERPTEVLEVHIPLIAQVATEVQAGHTPTEVQLPYTPHTEAINALPYTENDIILLCKLVYGEARGCSAEEQALVVWTVFNRLTDGRFGDTIEYIVTAYWKDVPQFAGYDNNNPVTDEIRAVVEAALETWASGESAPICPPYAKAGDYLYFSGDGQHNWFR